MKEDLQIFGHSCKFMFVFEIPSLPFSEYCLFIQPGPMRWEKTGKYSHGVISATGILAGGWLSVPPGYCQSLGTLKNGLS